MPACQLRLQPDVFLLTLLVPLFGVYIIPTGTRLAFHTAPWLLPFAEPRTIIILPPWKAPRVCDQITEAIDPALSLSVLPRPGEPSAHFIFVSRKPCPVNLLRRENMLMISARGLPMRLSRLLAPGWLLGPENQSRGLGHWAQCCLCG